jgi:tetratricopeptide (TPR) repeat protein
VNEYQGMHAGMNEIEDCIKKGNELFENNRFLEFISFCKKLTKKDIPNLKKAEIWYKISIAFHVLGSHANAVSAINKALSLNQNNPVYWVHKGDLLQSEKGHRFDDAIHSYKTAARLSPKNPDPLIKLGLLYESRNDHQKAIETYNKALELNPDNPQIWYNKGFSLNSILYRKEREKKLLQLTGDLSNEIQFMNEILTTFKKVLELDPRNSDALYSIGVLYTRMKKYSDALQYFDEALKYYSKEDEKPTQIWYSKAEVLDKVGKTHEASELFEKYEMELKKDFEDFFRHHRIGYRT